MNFINVFVANPQTAKRKVMEKENIKIKTEPQKTDNDSLSAVEARVIQHAKKPIKVKLITDSKRVKILYKTFLGWKPIYKELCDMSGSLRVDIVFNSVDDAKRFLDIEFGQNYEIIYEWRAV